MAERTGMAQTLGADPDSGVGKPSLGDSAVVASTSLGLYSLDAPIAMGEKTANGMAAKRWNTSTYRVDGE